MTTATDDRSAPAQNTASPLRATVRRTGGRCAALFLTATASTVLSLALPLALGRALDLLLANPDGSGGVRWVLWCAALVLLLAVLDAVETVLGGTTTARATALLRHRLTGHLLAVGPRAGERFGSGELVARLVGNAAQAGIAPASLAALLAGVAGPVGAVVALGLLDPWLAAVFLAGAPLLALLLRTFTHDSAQCAADYQKAQGLIARGLAEAIGGARTIAASGTADREAARILRPLPELARAGHRMWHVQGRAAARAVALAPLLQLGVVAVAGVLLVHGRLTVGEMLAASRYAVLAAGVGVLVGQLSGLVRARASALRIGEVLAEPVTRYGGRRLPPGRGRLELRGVTARRGGRTVLDGVDLVVPGGSTLAVVGRSGAGKSLLAALAGRLADPDEGTVLLDGVPLPELDHGELRRAIGCAFERPALLGDTVADTIGFGVRTAPPDRIRAGAAAARADTFVRRLPDGYATPCRAAPLSGGERQRLGLARVLARDSRLLVLDDALSSLDTVTEHQVVDALLRHSPGGTRVVVAHRASTAARADTVAWLDAGRVRAVGTHAGLWRESGYREVFADGAG